MSCPKAATIRPIEGEAGCAIVLATTASDLPLEPQRRGILSRILHTVIGLAVFLRQPWQRNERGLSQSAENAILLAGAVAIATGIIVAITAFVQSHLPR